MEGEANLLVFCSALLAVGLGAVHLLADW